MDREQARRELLKKLEASCNGTYSSTDEVKAHIADLLAPQNIVYMTGDTHGQFDRVINFCTDREVEKENIFIIMGDAGLNYYGDRRDALNKECLFELPITFFCVHGNHEMRPSPTWDTSCGSITAGRCGWSLCSPTLSSPLTEMCTFFSDTPVS